MGITQVTFDVREQKQHERDRNLAVAGIVVGVVLANYMCDEQCRKLLQGKTTEVVV